MESRDPAQPFEDEVAAAPVFGQHRGHGILRSAQRLHRRLLRNRVGIRRAVALELVDGGDDGGGRQSIADPPAGHGVGLRKRARHGHGVLCLGLGRDRIRRARVDQPAVALVGNQPDAAPGRQVEDAAELPRLHQRPRGVRRRIDDDGFGLRGEAGLDHRRRQREAVPGAGVDEDALAAGIADDVPVSHPVRHGDHDFVARVDQHLHQVEDHLLAARRHDALGGLVRRAVVGGVAFADGLLQLERSTGGGVAGKVLLQRKDGGAFDVLGRWKIGFPGPEIHHVDAFAPQPFGLRGDLHR